MRYIWGCGNVGTAIYGIIMANQIKDNLVIDKLDVATLNDVFRRIQDRLDALDGLRGQVEVKDVVNTDAGVKYTDSNGTILHGFGNI